MSKWAAAIPLLGLLALAVAAGLARGGGPDAEGLRYAGGTLLGGLAGFALYHAAFGFTGGWRAFVRERKGAGLRAQMALIGLTCLVTYPLIGFEELTGWDMHPAILPMTFASAVGAALFGFGMQLGGGCASGTLFTAAGGSTRMVLTLVAFVAGSVIATHHLVEVWYPLGPRLGIESLPGTSLIALFGPLGGLLVLGGGLAAIWLVSAALERRAHGRLLPEREQGPWLTGPWTLLAGAVALAAVGIGSFLLFERPWGVTAGFALWGAQALEALGVELRDWGYWSGWRSSQLDESLLADRTSVMNFGIILGAFSASLLAGRFAPSWRLSPRDVATAVIGGLVMGYGARLAFGCNIGAYLGGLVSGSLHGLWWLVWGFLGSWAGIWARARIGMDPPAAKIAAA